MGKRLNHKSIVTLMVTFVKGISERKDPPEVDSHGFWIHEGWGDSLAQKQKSSPRASVADSWTIKPGPQPSGFLRFVIPELCPGDFPLT